MIVSSNRDRRPAAEARARESANRHDQLRQGLFGLSMQLDAIVAAPEVDRVRLAAIAEATHRLLHE